MVRSSASHTAKTETSGKFWEQQNNIQARAGACRTFLRNKNKLRALDIVEQSHLLCYRSLPGTLRYSDTMVNTADFLKCY